MHFSDAENHLVTTDATRRQYPLVLLVHTSIETDRSVRRFRYAMKHYIAVLLADSSVYIARSLVDRQRSADEVHRENLEACRRTIARSSGSFYRTPDSHSNAIVRTF